MKIKLYKIKHHDNYINVMLVDYMDGKGREVDVSYGDIYPRSYFETYEDKIHDCWGGDDIGNMSDDGEAELLSEIEAVECLSDEEIYKNIESFIARAKRFAQTLANEAFDKKIKGLCEKGGENGM